MQKVIEMILIPLNVFSNYAYCTSLQQIVKFYLVGVAARLFLRPRMLRCGSAGDKLERRAGLMLAEDRVLGVRRRDEASISNPCETRTNWIIKIYYFHLLLMYNLYNY